MKKRILGIPYTVFLILFVLLPLIIVVFYAFSDGTGHFTFDNFISFFTSSRTIATLIYSLWVAFLTTLICLLLAYPTAYALARCGLNHSATLLTMAVLPMWINFTLRITAVKEVLDFLEGNLAYYPFLNTLIGQTYDFLPFMILPIYTTLIHLDNGVIEAGRDLGASGHRLFLQVVLPLSKAGIISGITMVFLPAMTNYVVLDMLYNSTYIMGSLIGSYFSAYDWHNGSMISAILLLLIALFAMASDRSGGKENA